LPHQPALVPRSRGFGNFDMGVHKSLLR
jgi:hypothetical protein